MKVTIDSKNYHLDVEKAKQAGILRPAPHYPLLPGDVYVHVYGKDKINNFLLVQATYSPPRYQLLGIGPQCNSGPFFDNLHTLPEIEEYLLTNDMVYCKNIHSEIKSLVKQA